VAAADPEAAVGRFLRREGRTLWVGRGADAEAIDLDRGRIFVIAAGKAAIPMTAGALAVLGADVAGGAIIAKTGGPEWPPGADRWPLTLHRGGHPLPDAGGMAGTKAIVELLADTRPEDSVLCLISGGASALLTQPLLPLEDWRKLVEVFLKSGCTIRELNAVRRAIDRIKAGGLARACAPAACFGLILSDVIGNPLPVIGGGPTVPDDDLVVGAVAVLGRYDIARQVEKVEWQRLALALNQARYLHKAARPSVRNVVIGDVRDAATAALVSAIRLGFVGQLLTAHLDGEARDIGRLAAGIARDLPAGQCCILGGETTVTVRGKGQGGRNQELALAAALALEGQPWAAVLSFATDGEDGPPVPGVPPAAGAVVTGETARLARSYGIDPAAHLVNNDSHTFFSRLDEAGRGRAEPNLIATGATGTNVNDLLVILSYGG
jgi:hydroxypyruvate reductase